MSEDTDSDVDRTAGSPDSSEPLDPAPQRNPVLDEAMAALVLTKYHRYKGVLDDDQQARVTSFNLEEDFEAADTALSDIYMLKVAYTLPGEEGAGERNLDLVVKQLPQDPFARFFVKEAQFDLREIKFYTKIVPDMVRFIADHLPDLPAEKQLPVPKCYYPLGDDDVDPSRETVLVLEDLKSHDYRSPDFAQGLRLDQATLALEAVARMHALSLAMRLAGGGDRRLDDLYPFLFRADKATDSYQLLLDRGLPQLEHFLERRAPHMQPVLRCILGMRRDTKRLISALLSPDGCPVALLTHTDFWCQNLLFRADGRHCVLLDWQMVAYSRPTNDVALLVISSLPAELRRARQPQLLDAYWRAFVGFAAQLRVHVETQLGYTRHDLQRDYRRSQLLAILLCIGSVDVALGNAAAEQRLLDALEDLHAEQLFSQQTVAQCLAA